MAELPLVAEWQRATHHLLAALDAALADLALTPGEVNALACFGEQDAVPVRDLVARTGQRPSTFTGVLDRLERRGLVARRPNPADRRSTVAALTPEGRVAAQEVVAAFHRVEGRLPADVRTAVGSLRAIGPATFGPLDGAER
jgi:DNA-binding MarR family transcriptional regulator